MQAHSKVGTPLYMSPEVLRGKGYAFKSDVWSLGCILYELAVLKSPFKEEGLSLYGLFQKISKGVYPEIPPPYSDELRKMVHRMLDVDVSKRATIKDVCSVANKMRMVTEEARRKRKEQEAALKAEEAARKYVQKIENSSSGGGSDTSSPTKQLHDDDNNNNNNNETYEGKINNNIDNKHSARAQQQQQQQHATTNNNSSNKPTAGSKFSSPMYQQSINTMDRRSSSERRKHKKKRNNGPVRAKPHPPSFGNDGNDAHAKKTSSPPMQTQRQNTNNLTMLSPEKYNPNYNRGSDQHYRQSKSSNSSSSTTSNNNNSSSDIIFCYSMLISYVHISL